MSAQPYVQASRSSLIGDVVTNPATLEQSTVIAYQKSTATGDIDYLITDSYYRLLVEPTIGEVISAPDPLDTDVYQVVALVEDAVSGLIAAAQVELVTPFKLPAQSTWPAAESLLVDDGSSDSSKDTELDPVQIQRTDASESAAPVRVDVGPGTIYASESGVEVTLFGGFADDGEGVDLLITDIPDAGDPGQPAGLIIVNNSAAIDSADGAPGFSFETFRATSNTGISASSLGGNGGSGSGSGVAVFGDAGSGGDGGDSSAVTVTNDGNITTRADRGFGILAQSEGGRAGSGGGGGLSFAELEALDMTASGGKGGKAGPVTVTNNASIVTGGESAHGIYAFSAGGAAGQGSDSDGVFVNTGSGNVGGSARLVTVTNNGLVTTGNEKAVGILAQSIGGGGGDGGSASGLWVSAGKGNKGGEADKVVVNHNGRIITDGVLSTGILAQSIGGAGGIGGSASSVAPFVSLAFGGAGGSGQHSDTVTVNLNTTQQGLPSSIITRDELSIGVLAQSVGGGGGVGGNATGVALGPGLAAAVAVGGEGGAGGDGNTAVLSGTGSVITQGNFSTGIKVESIGGGGGNSGRSVAVSVQAFEAGAGASVSVSQDGGGAGDGGAVDVDFNGAVATAGHFSPGIFAQSVGGGGGNAGAAYAGSLSVGEASAAVSVGVAGSGGGGGLGGTVDATLGGDVVTRGAFSSGVLLQSVGGGGGNGGMSVAGSLSGGGEASATVSVSVGGGGGSGNKAGQVIADVATTIHTGVDQTVPNSFSPGLVVQSVGGSGGNGGLSVAGGLSASGGISGGVTVGVGGTGGTGGHGSYVDLDYDGVISTAGAHSTGLLVQSVGGGGGNGGGSVSAQLAGGEKAAGAISIGLGGVGAAAGNGGEKPDAEAPDTPWAVQADIGKNASHPATVVRSDGSFSAGIVVQSVGGGGGNGGFDVAASGTGSEKVSGSVAVGLGGNGGGGGDGKNVRSDIEASISTDGHHSDGLVVQSVGGGGGNGGFNVSATAGLTLAPDSASGSVSVGLGGRGAGGGSAGEVHSTFNGENFKALAASSDSGAASQVAPVPDIHTNGVYATGVLVQSVGGGGGNGGFDVAGAGALSGGSDGSVSVGIGGSGEKGGGGGKVTSTVNSSVVTLQAGSAAVVVQSVGGGGGNGGMNVSAAASLSELDDDSVAGSIAIGLGGAGGGGNSGGVVNSASTGDLSTSGAIYSPGLVVQSVGGGGGNGGTNISGTGSLSRSSGAISVGIGGKGGTGGAANTATSAHTGSVVTTGSYSPGVVVQSVGGGGGNGGMDIAGGLNFSTSSGGAVAVGLGGTGGSGNGSARVESKVTGDVTTGGDQSIAIIAQSVAGGGGNGAMNVSGSISAAKSTSASVSVGVGGFGGDAADHAGPVQLEAKGNLTTSGKQSTGLLAQSVGGGGGNGGLDVAGSISFKGRQGSSGAAIAVGVGGFGGKGGNSNNVDVDFEGSIDVEATDLDLLEFVRVELFEYEPSDSFEENAARAEILGYTLRDSGLYAGFYARDVYRLSNFVQHGLVAQSLAGGGGNGGTNITGELSYASDGESKALLVGVGGFGGDGGNAGNIDDTEELNVDLDIIGGGHINARGNHSYGVLAQSVGGGGGNGGINVSGGITSDAGVDFGIGGFGGNGGTSSHVDVNAATDISTDGAYAVGLMAQSVGGGGGNGALNVSGAIAIEKQDSDNELPGLTVGIGGFGGDGARSGNVNVTHVGNVSTSYQHSHGILAQSLAGGGGNGAVNITGSLSLGEDDGDTTLEKDLNIAVSIGGFAGDGANSGAVTLHSDGTVTTSGDHARGVFAQSIGGGGGTGGVNVTVNARQAGSPMSVGIGGFGGGGGHAGAVNLWRGAEGNPAGWVVTGGSSAPAIEASSIGGGGGDGGLNVIAGGTVNSGAAEQSLGYAAQVTIGGAGGKAGHGGTATVNNNGNALTNGDKSHGVMAQSIGGGGGNASLNLALAYDKYAKGLGVTIGGATGDGGAGKLVTINHQGTVVTTGANAFGVFGQSVGGGGGNAGFDIGAMPGNKGGNLAITVGRKGGTGGNSDDVEIDVGGSVNTSGRGSYGVLAQSVANGGGNSSATSVVGTSDQTGGEAELIGSFSLGIKGGDAGDAGDATITAAGSVITEGDDAHAIYAQSIGGGGGNAGAAAFGKFSLPAAGFALGGKGGTAGAGGAVTVISDASIRTSGGNAIGIFAQSIGGGGGTGGGATGFGKRPDSKVSFDAAVGGSGGDGVNGGLVHVGNSAQIWTSGERSYGVLAQSIGGGGGVAGMVVNLADNTASDYSATLIHGGDGGEGTAGGQVSVDNTGLIFTEAQGAIGIFAQSIGGGGGISSTIVSGQSNGAQQTQDSAFFIKQGLGGTGGAGNAVTVTNKKAEPSDSADPNTGVIYTKGDRAHGIFALSLGGSGGNTGAIYNIQRAAGSPVAQGSADNNINVTLGGTAGTGGSAGLVHVVNDGLIVTEGIEAYGIFASSIGGGGGTANLLVSKMITDSKNTTNANLSLGGSGGSGNISGNVIVDNFGDIETFSGGSHGIFAQSVGGGGGDAGNVISLATNLDKQITPLKNILGNIGLGGSGGNGADSGGVTVNHSGRIITHGDNTYGIVAQTIGGGGGMGKHALTAPAAMVFDAAVTTNLGGLVGDVDSLGDPGLAGRVTLNTNGTIQTFGKNSKAYFVNSVNGGGGDLTALLDISEAAGKLAGEEALEGSVDLPPPSGFVATINHLNQMGQQYVLGAIAPITDGINEQVDSYQVGNLFTSGDDAAAQHIQNVRGGGGNYQLDLLLSQNSNVNLYQRVGSTNSPGNAGGDNLVTREGDAATAGKNSAVVTIQSIGGGGGHVSVNVQTGPGIAGSGDTAPVPPGQIIPTPPEAPVLPMASASASAAASHISLELGAAGGADDHGGDLELDFTGNVSATGERSPGLILQSIGGGGGMVHLRGVQTVSAIIGGNDGTDGDGGEISLVNTGDIFTEAELSHGALLQSIGGGGGAILTDTVAESVAVELSGANSGDGGTISFTQAGDIQVSGDQSIALIAQSLGGGGGIVDRVFAGSAGGAGNSGDITLALEGQVSAHGLTGVGIYAQSAASNQRGDIYISIAESSIVSGGSNGVGIWIDGGAENRLENRGSVFTADGIDGIAVRAGDGDIRIDNFGAFYGEFELGDGANSFVNHPGAMLFSGASLALGGVGNELVNEGNLMFGGMGLAQRSELSGSFTQSASGVSHIELDFLTDKIDDMYVTGAVDLAGDIDVSLLNPQLVAPGKFEKVILSGAGGVNDNGVQLTAAPSLVISYNLVFPESDNVAASRTLTLPPAASLPETALLEWAVDFAPEWLDAETIKMGRYFNRVQEAGSSPELAEAVVGLLYEDNRATYEHYLEQLSPEFYAQQHGQLVRSNLAFGERMLSCKQAGGDFSFTREGSCMWLQADYEDVDISENGAVRDAEFDVTRLSFGVQKTFPSNVSFGVAVSTSDVDGDGDNGSWNSDGTTNQVGMALKYRRDGAKFSAALTYGKNDTDTRRRLDVLGADIAKADRDMTVWGGLLRYTHDFGAEDYYLRPGIDLGFSRVEADGANEEGAAGLSLVLEDNDQTHGWVQPSLEAGMDKQFEDGKTVRFYGKVGVQEYFQNSQAKVFAEFSGAPSGIQAIEQEIDIGETTVHATVGVDLLLKNEFSVQLQYRYSEADELEVNSGFLKISMPF